MKKAVAVVLSALLFGAVAGGTILGINYAGRSRMNNAANETQAEEETQEETKEEETEAEKETEAQTKASTGSTERTRLDVSDIVEEAMPQVVSITNTMVVQQQGYSSIFEYFYGGGAPQEYEVPASGSGVILKKTDDELLIVTNNHVVEDSKELSVTFIDGTSIDANVKGTDPTMDIAVIAIPLSDIPDDTMKAIKVANYHEADDLKVGQGVIAIGNALGYGQTVTVGYISALNREITAENTVYSDLIQTDAAINPGNSGGALLNMDGEVIGINVAKLSSTQVEGFGYSIPIYKVMDTIENLSNAKTKVEIDENKRGRLGIYMNTISQDNATALGIPAGVIIKGFSDEYVESYGEDSVQESPAKEAGLLKNDIITEFDGQKVTSAEGLSELVAYYEEGTKVDVTVERLENGSYAEHTVTVTLGSRQDPKIKPVAGDDSEDSSKPSFNGSNGNNGNGNNGRPSFNGQNPPAPKDRPANGEQPSDKENESNADSSDGSQNEDNQAETSTEDDLYELFKEFLDQYQ